ncbi:S-methyl-5'-thioadenosine phosphorylase [Candidatus Woesearchaeota archaeon CG11_big_fil_rev_8_21_14_0_20_43_8]|nr:MAG: S-methyl-5'-thioadenosine phosphorylase [Candidatus Woesearchaeota archaeon CG11_big_fil_rev_8_21_14_0_20_43_8]
MVKIGIIGGTGVYDPHLVEDEKKNKVHTPYGSTSDFVMTGKFKGVDIVVIPRHGNGHIMNPSNVNYRANVWAMKELGVTHIIAPSAVGSLKEEYKPGDLVMTDQFIDRTTKRDQSFYEGNQVCHIGMAEPMCAALRGLLNDTAKKLGLRHHEKGTVVVIEGPRFSSRAESNLYRSWNADIISMTLVPEAVLAREAGICYASVGMVTDYDCWKEEEVTSDMVVQTMKANAENVKKLLQAVIPLIKKTDCKCASAICHALL